MARRRCQMDALWDQAKAKEKAASRPRARVRALTLLTTRLAQASAFLDAVAPVLGLTRVGAPPGEARCASGPLEFIYRESKAPGAFAPAQVELEAESREDLELTFAALVPMGAERPTPFAVELRDPDGNLWRIVCAP